MSLVVLIFAVPVAALGWAVLGVEPGEHGCTGIGDGGREPYVFILCKTRFEASKDGTVRVDGVAVEAYHRDGQSTPLNGPPLEWEDLWLRVEEPGIRVEGPHGVSSAPPGERFPLGTIGDGPLEVGQELRFCKLGPHEGHYSVVWIGQAPHGQGLGPEDGARGTLPFRSMTAC